MSERTLPSRLYQAQSPDVRSESSLWDDYTQVLWSIIAPDSIEMAPYKAILIASKDRKNRKLNVCPEAEPNWEELLNEGGLSNSASGQ